jgi:hypothetical protein
VPGDRAIRRVGQSPADAEVRSKGPVAVHEPPARVTLALGQVSDERRCGGVVERKQGEALASVEADDGTRRPAAEPSAGVVEENRPLDRHRELSNPSRVARTSGPMVSST